MAGKTIVFLKIIVQEPFSTLCTVRAVAVFTSIRCHGGIGCVGPGIRISLIPGSHGRTMGGHRPEV
jgi:hypothetical protein